MSIFYFNSILAKPTTFTVIQQVAGFLSFYIETDQLKQNSFYFEPNFTVYLAVRADFHVR